MKDPKKLQSLEDMIAAALREAQASGELQTAKGWGKPLDFGDGYDDTPPELRMAFKVLKDSGFAPAEVQMLRDQAELRERLASLDAHSDEAAALRQKISQLEVEISLRIERFAKAGPKG